MEDLKPWEVGSTFTERQETINSYNQHAEEQDQRYRQVRPEGRIKDVEKAFEYFGGDEPAVVELGCGSGREATAILERTDQYLGIDISAEMIRIAQANNPNARFVVSDVVGYEFPDMQVDIIFAFASLLHLNRNEVARVLAKCHATLSPGGIFYISLKQGEYRREVKENEYGRRTFYYYTPTDIQELAGEDYETIEIDEHLFNDVSWFTIALRKVDVIPDQGAAQEPDQPFRTFLVPKLLRDGIPLATEAIGGHFEYETVEGREHIRALIKKIIEEASELEADAVSLEELADIKEALDTLMELSGISPDDLEEMQAKKRARIGGFMGGKMGKSVTVPRDSEWAKYYGSDQRRFPEIGG